MAAIFLMKERSSGLKSSVSLENRLPMGIDARRSEVGIANARWAMAIAPT